jgi:transposase
MTTTISAITFVGIDVSKDELVIAYYEQGHLKKCKVKNTVETITDWLCQLPIEGKHFVLEHTGVYSHRLIHSLHEQNALFSVVNPAQSRAMAKLLSKTHKNDDQDAQTLCVLGQKLDVKPYKMPDNMQKSRKEAFSALISLRKHKQQLKNQLHAFEYHVNPNPVAVKALEDALKGVQDAIDALEKEILPKQVKQVEQNKNESVVHQNSENNEHITSQQTDSDSMSALLELICSIKCVGTATAQACITLFGDLKHFDNAKAFIKFIGLSPTEFTSGSSVKGRNFITKKGKAIFRSLLFNCARSAIRFNPLCKELYDRLIKNGKNGKLALTAVMHKLARLIYGVLSSGVPFDLNFAKNKHFVQQ